MPCSCLKVFLTVEISLKSWKNIAKIWDKVEGISDDETVVIILLDTSSLTDKENVHRRGKSSYKTYGCINVQTIF